MQCMPSLSDGYVDEFWRLMCMLLLVWDRTHQVLEPVRVKVRLDELYLALVSMLPGSLPWLGSVRPKHPRSSPCAVGHTAGQIEHRGRVVQSHKSGNQKS